MVPRYARPEMTAIWSAENRFRIWFEIEAHATDALAELGTVSAVGRQGLVGMVGDESRYRRGRDRRDRSGDEA